MVKILKAIKKCEQFHLLILFSQRGINYLWGRWKEQLEINMSWIFNIYIVIRFFSTVMYGCESWTIKKTEHRRIDAFKLWSWRRLLRVPWTAGSNQSILLCSPVLKVQLSHLYRTTGKTIDVMIQIFVSKVMSLLFNMLLGLS